MQTPQLLSASARRTPSVSWSLCSRRPVARRRAWWPSLSYEGPSRGLCLAVCHGLMWCRHYIWWKQSLGGGSSGFFFGTPASVFVLLRLVWRGKAEEATSLKSMDDFCVMSWDKAYYSDHPISSNHGSLFGDKKEKCSTKEKKQQQQGSSNNMDKGRPKTHQRRRSKSCKLLVKLQICFSGRCPMHSRLGCWEFGDLAQKEPPWGPLI